MYGSPRARAPTYRYNNTNILSCANMTWRAVIAVVAAVFAQDCGSDGVVERPCRRRRTVVQLRYYYY